MGLAGTAVGLVPRGGNVSCGTMDAGSERAVGVSGVGCCAAKVDTRLLLDGHVAGEGLAQNGHPGHTLSD